MVADYAVIFACRNKGPNVGPGSGRVRGGWEGPCKFPAPAATVTFCVTGPAESCLHSSVFWHSCERVNRYLLSNFVRQYIRNINCDERTPPWYKFKCASSAAYGLLPPSIDINCIALNICPTLIQIQICVERGISVTAMSLYRPIALNLHLALSQTPASGGHDVIHSLREPVDIRPIIICEVASVLGFA